MHPVTDADPGSHTCERADAEARGGGSWAKSWGKGSPHFPVSPLLLVQDSPGRRCRLPSNRRQLLLNRRRLPSNRRQSASNHQAMVFSFWLGTPWAEGQHLHTCKPHLSCSCASTSLPHTAMAPHTGGIESRTYQLCPSGVEVLADPGGGVCPACTRCTTFVLTILNCNPGFTLSERSPPSRPGWTANLP